MLRAYIAAGFEPAQFWSLTPRLYLAHMSGANDRLASEHKNRAWLAWHVEALARQKTLPDIQKFMGGKIAQPKRQSPEILQAMGDALSRAWGAQSLEKSKIEPSL